MIKYELLYFNLKWYDYHISAFHVSCCNNMQMRFILQNYVFLINMICLYELNILKIFIQNT